MSSKKDRLGVNETVTLCKITNKESDITVQKRMVQMKKQIESSMAVLHELRVGKSRSNKRNS